MSPGPLEKCEKEAKTNQRLTAHHFSPFAKTSFHFYTAHSQKHLPKSQQGMNLREIRRWRGTAGQRLGTGGAGFIGQGDGRSVRGV